MKSALPKVLHPIAGRPMLAHLLGTVESLFDRVVVVAGPDMDTVARVAAPHEVAIQAHRLGTGHAALQAAPSFGEGEVAILNGDNPLVSAQTLLTLLAARRGAGVSLAMLAMRPPEPGAYGRVIARAGQVIRIVEAKDATAAELAETLCATGAYCADAADMRRWLQALGNDNAAREYYITDIVALAAAEGRVAAVEAPYGELRGINSRAELAEAEASVQAALRLKAMDSGVTLMDPASVYLCADTDLAADVTVGPHVVFGPGVRVASGAEIRAFSHLEGCVVGAGAIVGPFARLRPGAVLGASAHVGNFVEIKAAILGDGAKANHLAYIGDAEVGARTNIGAGTITCNYDGFAKHKTTIGGDAFIGSDSVLVAPLTIGDGALIAAGSVVTEDVPPDAMAFGRARQETKPGLAASFRKQRKGKR